MKRIYIASLAFLLSSSLASSMQSSFKFLMETEIPKKVFKTFIPYSQFAFSNKNDGVKPEKETVKLHILPETKPKFFFDIHSTLPGYIEETSNPDILPKITKSESLKEEIEKTKILIEKKKITHKDFLKKSGHFGVISKNTDTQRVDRRKIITDPYLSPYNSTVYLELDFSSDPSKFRRLTSSGVLIGDKYIITTGHSLYVHNPEEEFTKTPSAAAIYIGMNERSCLYKLFAERIEVHEKWKNDGDWKYDIGFISLQEGQLNWEGYQDLFDKNNPIIRIPELVHLQNDKLINASTEIPGYPANKVFGRMYSMTGKITEVDEEEIYHNIDTSGGNSGSGVFLKNTFSPNKNSQLIAIHSGIYSDHPSLLNVDTRIVKFLLDYSEEELRGAPQQDDIKKLNFLKNENIDYVIETLRTISLKNRAVRLTQSKQEKIVYWKSLN